VLAFNPFAYPHGTATNLSKQGPARQQWSEPEAIACAIVGKAVSRDLQPCRVVATATLWEWIRGCATVSVAET
jgi:hypothetical protein